ncbi:hypothetical protein CEXT_347791 [Caerostris extrusa]|uniref:Maturase K n=1 Tax=Caerostris extrusa TaxID=172846 RepID=A0AAV4MFN6_CAEEX|nr:hypothetical protein CEXT_347791 [Caerostris extrusa]
MLSLQNKVHFKPQSGPARLFAVLQDLRKFKRFYFLTYGFSPAHSKSRSRFQRYLTSISHTQDGFRAVLFFSNVPPLSDCSQTKCYTSVS